MKNNKNKEENQQIESVEKEIWNEWETFKPLFKGIFKRNEENNFLECNNKSIVLKDAYKTLNLGLEDTAQQQSVEFYKIIKRESKRTLSFRHLIFLIHQQRILDPSITPIDFLVGKNCCAFIDSAGKKIFF